MGFATMKNNLIILFLLCSLSAFAQPSVVDTTRFSVRNGNAYFVATASALKTYIAALSNGGNSFGGAITVGTNDNFALNFETNGTTQASLSTAGVFSIGSSSALQISNSTFTPGQNYTLQNGSNTITLGSGAGIVNIGGGSSGTVNIDGGSSGVNINAVGHINVTRTQPSTTVRIPMYFNAESSLTPAAGFGIEMIYRAESNTTSNREVGIISMPWTTATDASRTSDMVFSTVNSATTNEAFRLYGNQRAMVGGGTNEASAAFQVNSTSGGLLPPKMTNAQMLAIATPAEGLEVYNTTIGGKCIYNGTDWERLSCSKTPTVTVGAGAGTGASASVVGNDMAGVITVTTGTSLVVGNIVTLDFHTDYDVAPRAVIISGANEAGSAMIVVGGATRNWYAPSADITTVDFEIDSGSVFNSAAESTEYKLYYHVIQ